MPSRPQFYAVFALITRCSTPTSCRLHTGVLQNFKTNAEDLRRNPYKMQPVPYGIPYHILPYSIQCYSISTLVWPACCTPLLKCLLGLNYQLQCKHVLRKLTLQPQCSNLSIICVYITDELK